MGQRLLLLLSLSGCASLLGANFDDEQTPGDAGSSSVAPVEPTTPSEQRPGPDKTCPSETQSCDGSCVQTASDPSHCGSCGHACTAPAHARAICATGTCGMACETGFSPCASGCCSTVLDGGGAPEAGVFCDGGTCWSCTTSWIAMNVRGVDECNATIQFQATRCGLGMEQDPLNQCPVPDPTGTACWQVGLTRSSPGDTCKVVSGLISTEKHDCVCRAP